MIKIRQACLSDASIIAEFNVRMALETEQRRLDLARVHAGVTALLTDPTKGLYFLAEAAEASSEHPTSVAGQLLITYEWSDWRNGNFWWLQSVYVAESFRGQGVFRALFNHIRDLAAARRDVKVYLMADGYASQSLSAAFIKLLEDGGVNFRFFEPLFKSTGFYFGRRLHHKIVVVDTRQSHAFEAEHIPGALSLPYREITEKTTIWSTSPSAIALMIEVGER